MSQCESVLLQEVAMGYLSVTSVQKTSADTLFSEYLEVSYPAELREKFKNGLLVTQLANDYPELYDQNDIALATGPQGQKGYHFVEWFAALALYKEFGLLSLIGKYECPSHKRKRDVIKRFMSAEDIDYISKPKEPFGSTQCPDLFLYKKDFSDFCFCEVKGPGDTLKPNQAEYFQVIKEKYGKPVYLLSIKETSLDEQDNAGT
jgi:hypothetical protein